jgi:hypothetical protein
MFKAHWSCYFTRNFPKRASGCDFDQMERSWTAYSCPRLFQCKSLLFSPLIGCLKEHQPTRTILASRRSNHQILLITLDGPAAIGMSAELNSNSMELIAISFEIFIFQLHLSKPFFSVIPLNIFEKKIPRFSLHPDPPRKVKVRVIGEFITC